MAKTHNVNLDKALAEIRQYPDERIDREMFKTIANYVNGKGETILSVFNTDIGMSTDNVNSLIRLVKHGLITLSNPIAVNDDNRKHPHDIDVSVKIAPAYMLNTPCDGVKATADVAKSKADFAASRVTLASVLSMPSEPPMRNA